MTDELTPIPQLSEIVSFIIRNLSHVSDTNEPSLKKKLQRLRDGAPLSVDSAMELLETHIESLLPAKGNDDGWSHKIRQRLNGYVALCMKLDCAAIPASAIRQIFDRVAAHAFFEFFAVTLKPTGVSADDILTRPETATALLWQARLKDGNLSDLAHKLEKLPGLRREGEHWDRLLRGWQTSKHQMRSETILRLMEHWDGQFARALLLAHAYENYCKLKTVDPTQHARHRALSMNIHLIRQEIEALRTDTYTADCDLSPEIEAAANSLARLTDPTRPKADGEAAQAASHLRKIDLALAGQQRIAGLGALRGRYLAQMGQYDDALKALVAATAWFRLRSAAQMKICLRHLLILAASLDEKETLKKWRAWSEALGLSVSIQDPQLALAREFPHPFPEAGNAKRPHPGEKYVICLPDWREKKVDKRSPNRVIKGYGQTPNPQLTLFASLGQPEKVRALLAEGADPDKLDQNYGSALLCALQEGDEGCVDILLSVTARATINTRTRKGHSPLHEAISKCHRDWVRALILKGADIEIPGRHGQSPLYHAVSLLLSPAQLFNGAQDPRVIERQISRFPTNLTPTNSPFVKDQVRATTEMFVGHSGLLRELSKGICRNTDEIPHAREIIFALLEAGANPNQSIIDEAMTPFLYAAEIGDEWLLRSLIDHGADVRSRDDRGATAFVRLNWFGHSELATRFLTWLAPAERLWLRSTTLRR